MAHFPAARARIVLFLLVVAAPVTATLAFERAAEHRPAAAELRRGRPPAHRTLTEAQAVPENAANQTKRTK